MISKNKSGFKVDPLSDQQIRIKGQIRILGGVLTLLIIFYLLKVALSFLCVFFTRNLIHTFYVLKYFILMSLKKRETV